jgi:hypothetical protein
MNAFADAFELVPPEMFWPRNAHRRDV